MAGEPVINLVGNVGADPELRFIADGTAVCTLRVANTERKLINGEWQDIRTNWFRVTAWRADAEAAAEHITKGTKVSVSGKLTFSEYEKDGKQNVVPEISADVIAIVPRPLKKNESKKPETNGSPW